MWRGTGARRQWKRALIGLSFTAVALIVPLMVGALTTGYKLRTPAMPPYSLETPLEAPAHDPARMTAVVVAGVEGSESSDLLAPYQILAASGAFNVYTVAPERRLTPLFPGSPSHPGLDMIPHFSFDEFSAEVGVVPDLIVVPFIPSTTGPVDAPILGWLRDNVDEHTLVLSICGGAKIVADAGLLDGLTATTHRNIFQFVEPVHTDTEWVRGVRWVHEGNVISSAGITSGIDATLRALHVLAGRDVALSVAADVGYPYVIYLDDPRFTLPERAVWASRLSAAYRWEMVDIGLALYDGVDELSLTAITDTYPRSFGTTIHTIAPERTVITTRHGLHLVPRHSFDDAPAFDRVLVPGTDMPATVSAAFEEWAQQTGQPAVEHIHRDSGDAFVFDATLQDMSRANTQALAGLAAAGLEYPIEHLTLSGSAWPYDLLARPVALSVFGMLALYGALRIAATLRRAKARPTPRHLPRLAG